MARETQQMKKTSRSQSDDTIDILRLLKALWHRAWAIVLAAIICGGIGFSYSAFFITPLYQSAAMIYVNNSEISVGNTSVSFSTSELSAAQSLVDTYVVILNTRTTLEEVIDAAGLDYNYKQLLSMIDAEAVNETEIFSVTVTSDDPEEAALIANTIADILPDRISEVVEGSSVKIVDTAVVSTSKVSPNITKYTSYGILAGIVLSCAIIIIMVLFDDVVHDEKYLLDTFDYPLLAVIPDLNAGKSKGGYYSYGSYSSYSNSYSKSSGKSQD